MAPDSDRSTQSFHLLCVLLLCLSAPLGAEITNLSARLDPVQPLFREDFLLIVEGTADGAVTLDGIDITADEFGDGGLHVYLLESSPGPAPEDFRVEIDVPGNRGFADGELYDLRLFRRDTSGATVAEQVFHRLFAVGGYFDHPLEPQVVPHPPHPSDNENVSLLIPTRTDDCRFSSPRVERVVREAGRISLFLQYRGPLADSPFVHHEGPSPSAKCTPSGGLARLDTLPVDIGTLPPGSYRVDLYLRSTGGTGSLPILAAQAFFHVVDAEDVVVLQNGRFVTRVQWKDFEGASGPGSPVPGATDDSTLFTFFGEENWELLVKVLDGCDINGHFWVLTAAATTVEYEITIEDTFSDEEWTFHNPLGVSSPAVSDVTAFACDDD